jgi:hypothetical protein
MYRWCTEVQLLGSDSDQSPERQADCLQHDLQACPRTRRTEQGDKTVVVSGHVKAANASSSRSIKAEGAQWLEMQSVAMALPSVPGSRIGAGLQRCIALPAGRVASRSYRASRALLLLMVLSGREGRHYMKACDCGTPRLWHPATVALPVADNARNSVI